MIPLISYSASKSPIESTAFHHCDHINHGSVKRNGLFVWLRKFLMNNSDLMFRSLFITTICIALFPKPSSASSDSLFFSTLSIRDGLPSNIINSIAQDKNDFIWIGTSNGLCRYDGHRFITFKREGSNSLPANEISSLLIDGDFIWVGTWKGLCKINTLTFEVVPIDVKGNNIIRALCKGNENSIWVGTTTGLIKYSKHGLTEYNTSNSNISHNTIRAILTDKYGNLWVGTYDKVNKLPKGQNSFVQIDLKRNYKPELKIISSATLSLLSVTTL